MDIEPVDSGHFDVIMERSPVSAWWWYVGQTAQQALDTALQNGARVFDIERYDTPAGPRFATIMVNNSNEVTTRVGEVLRQSNATADTGLYLKQVAGPVLASLREGDRFEPASMIKALLNLTAMRAVQAGQASLNDPLFMYYDPANPHVGHDAHPLGQRGGGAGAEKSRQRLRVIARHVIAACAFVRHQPGRAGEPQRPAVHVLRSGQPIPRLRRRRQPG